MFQFRRFPAYAYLIQRTLTEYCSAGFPHSEISGSMDICSSPQLIAACHVLRRLLMPRHSPCALYSLTYRRTIFLTVLVVELCRHHRFCNCYCYPHFQMLSTIQINFTLSSLLESLSVALLSHFDYIVQFSRCSLCPVKARNKYSSLLNTYFRAYLRFGGPEWARTTDLTIISRTL